MKKYAADNLMFLRKSYPNIYETVRNRKYDTGLVKISKNRSNQVILQVMDDASRFQSLYSRYDVYLEVERWLDSIQGEILEAQHVLFCGLGLGYHLQAFINRHPDKQIYLYEPDLNVLLAAIECVDLRDILKHKQIHVFAVGDDIYTQMSFVMAVFDTIKGSVFTMIPPTHRNIYSQPLKQLQETISKLTLIYKTNLNTMSLHQLYWAENIVRNMEKVLNSYSFAAMKDSLSGIPVVIVGSGPSLDMEIEWLRKLKNKVMIIAAGTSIQGLLHHGVKPDLVVSMDPNVPNLRAFQNVKDTDVPMLFIPTIHADILDKDWKILLHAVFSNDELTKFWLKDLKKELAPPVFLTSASVTGTAIQAAVYMGCNELVLIGQDLSFPADRFYSSGVRHISPDYLAGKVKGADLFVENVSGGINRTDKLMLLIKNDIETIFEILNIKKVYNASKVGAMLRKTEFKSLEQLYAELQHTNLGDDWFYHLLRERSKPYSDEQKHSLIQKINKIYDGIVELKEIVEELGQYLSVISPLQTKGRREQQRWLDDYMKVWHRFANHPIFTGIYHLFLNREINYVSRYWTELQAETDEWVKIQNVAKYSNIITTSFIRVTNVLNTNFAKLKDKLQRCE